MKNIEAIFFEIEIKQIREEELKGKLNRELCIIMYDVNNNLYRKTPWKKNDINLLNRIMPVAENDALVSRVTISNNYSDWEVEVLSKV